MGFDLHEITLVAGWRVSYTGRTLDPGRPHKRLSIGLWRNSADFRFEQWWEWSPWGWTLGKAPACRVTRVRAVENAWNWVSSNWMLIRKRNTGEAQISEGDKSRVLDYTCDTWDAHWASRGNVKSGVRLGHRQGPRLGTAGSACGCLTLCKPWFCLSTGAASWGKGGWSNFFSRHVEVVWWVRPQQAETVPSPWDSHVCGKIEHKG